VVVVDRSDQAYIDRFPPRGILFRAALLFGHVAVAAGTLKVPHLTPEPTLKHSTLNRTTTHKTGEYGASPMAYPAPDIARQGRG